jgi:hypothetical protein
MLPESQKVHLAYLHKSELVELANQGYVKPYREVSTLWKFCKSCGLVTDTRLAGSAVGVFSKGGESALHWRLYWRSTAYSSMLRTVKFH